MTAGVEVFEKIDSEGNLQDLRGETDQVISEYTGLTDDPCTDDALTGLVVNMTIEGRFALEPFDSPRAISTSEVQETLDADNCEQQPTDELIQRAATLLDRMRVLGWSTDAELDRHDFDNEDRFWSFAVMEGSGAMLYLCAVLLKETRKKNGPGAQAEHATSTE